MKKIIHINIVCGFSILAGNVVVVDIGYKFTNYGAKLSFEYSF